ncbi:sporulation initiation factor Spo0A C-terminal domain-containing protein [Ruminococcus sp.]
MKERILVCDTSPSLGKLMARRFANMGISADFCRGNISSVSRAMAAKKYSCLLIFAFSPEKQLLELVSAAAEKGIHVFAGLYTSSASVHRSFRNAGAAAAFTMPCSVRTMCKRIIMRIGNKDTILSRVEVFLEETGFPKRLRGFAYLANISTVCLAAPERLWGGMSELYGETADKLSTEASREESAIRNLRDQAAENGSVSRLTDGRLAEKPTNTELICAVCDKFSRC